MSNALAVVDFLSAGDMEVLKTSKFKGFSNEEVAYAGKVCATLRLSPFLNQIHFVKRGQAVVPQVGIDGFRLSAQRAGGYAGSDEAVYEYGPGAGPNGEDRKRPLKATVTVWRMVEGQRCAFTASVLWSEFYSPVGGMWDKLPHQMLGKCAEAQALRKAFPSELSGVHTPEEMDQAGAPTNAQNIEAKILPPSAVTDAVEAEARPVADSISRPGVCPLCKSSKTMRSKHHANSGYCLDCKKAFDL